MFNIFKRKSKQASSSNSGNAVPGMENMNMLQRIAMKKVMSMSPEQRMKMMQKVMTPQNIAKHKDQLLAAMEQMKKSGQMTEQQVREARQRLGI